VDHLGDPVEEVLLGVDVVVERALEQADGGGDVLQRGRGVALAVEDLRRRLVDLLLALQRERRGRAGPLPSASVGPVVGPVVGLTATLRCYGWPFAADGREPPP
jgi:hypothetical protein